HGALASNGDPAGANADSMLARLPDVDVAIDVDDVDADRAAHVVRIVVAMPVVRMADVQVMVRVQMVRVPTDRESGRYTPEVTGPERIRGRRGVVLDRIGPRVVPDRRVVMVMMGGHLARLVVRHVDDLRVRRRDSDRARVLGNHHALVAGEITRFARL